MGGDKQLGVPTIQEFARSKNINVPLNNESEVKAALKGELGREYGDMYFNALLNYYEKMAQQPNSGIVDYEALAIAAYHAGYGNINKYVLPNVIDAGGDISYQMLIDAKMPKTAKYLEKVTKAREQLTDTTETSAAVSQVANAPITTPSTRGQLTENEKFNVKLFEGFLDEGRDLDQREVGILMGMVQSGKLNPANVSPKLADKIRALQLLRQMQTN
jgi:hypothetical protein